MTMNMKGSKDFECKECNKKFGLNGDLKSHVILVHEGRKDFKCEKCLIKFKESSRLNPKENSPC